MYFLKSINCLLSSALGLLSCQIELLEALQHSWVLGVVSSFFLYKKKKNPATKQNNVLYDHSEFLKLWTVKQRIRGLGVVVIVI